MLILGSFLAVACAQPYDYRAVSPRWQITNSPIPVPTPKAKPAVQRVTWTPKPAQPKRSAAVYTVQAGDTVYGLARRYGVSAQTLIQLNGLKAPYHLARGQTLVFSGAPAPRQVAKPAPVKAVKVSAPSKPIYRVRKGDGVYAIARRHGVVPAELIRINSLKKPYVLKPGQTLRLPGASATKAVVKAPLSPKAGSATFIWPVTGKVVSGYGVKADGLRNDGVNIAARSGAPVYAAAAGEVIYAGKKLRAFGNLILLRHSNGMVSAYAHLSSYAVQPGDWVVQGQQIARVGNTGLVQSPQLHFELRRDSRAIDPMRYLGRTQMAAAGR